MVSDIVQPPKLPIGQLWGNFQRKTGPVAMVLRFFQLHHLADHYTMSHFLSRSDGGILTSTLKVYWSILPHKLSPVSEKHGQIKNHRIR